jgi:hypothetical protein
MKRSYVLAGVSLAAMLVTGFALDAQGKGKGAGKAGACKKGQTQTTAALADEKETPKTTQRQPGQRQPGQRQPGRRPGVGGPGGPRGGVLPAFLQTQLKLTDEQKKQVADLQKEVDAKLGKILTADQMKTLKEMRERGGRFGTPGGRPGEGGRPGGRRPGGNRPQRPPQ